MPQEIVSSYAPAKYGEIFSRTVFAWRPSTIVELGILNGYSTLYLSRGIKDLRASGMGDGHIDAYDLFEDYPYNHGSQAEVQKMLEDEGVADIVTLHKEDAFGNIPERYNPKTVGLLHIDLSNTGETLAKMIEAWDSRLPYGGIVMFEGGSEERDQVEWMVKYNKKPIKPELETNKLINDKYVYGTYLEFPSLTILLKKRE